MKFIIFQDFLRNTLGAVSCVHFILFPFTPSHPVSHPVSLPCLQIRTENITEKGLLSWQKFSSENGRELLPTPLLSLCQDVVSKQKVVEEATSVVSKQNAEMQKIVSNQSRVRENLKSLEKISQSQKLVDRYLSDLNMQEDEMSKLRKMIEAAEDKKIKEEHALKKLKMEAASEASTLLTAMP
jgi:hypothetical protein